MNLLKKILDKLKLVGFAVLLIGALVAVRIYNPFSHDDEIVDLAGKLAIELCECTGPSCADRILSEAIEKLAGQEVSSEIGGAHTKANDQIMYMEKCHALITQNAKFVLDTHDGRVVSVTESIMNDLKIDPSLFLESP